VTLLQLPHTAGCLVCGRDNPHGLRLDLRVEPESATVVVLFTPQPEHIGFEGVVHGGILATVLDEAMVWSATWAGRRFCVCAEMTIRFRREVAVGQALAVEAKVESNRARLVVTAGIVRDVLSGEAVATATGKYVPVPPERNRAFVQTLVPHHSTEKTARVLRSAVAPQ
jgi:acyl-coenzyme A thioesterase PaaI-like protein